MGLTDRVAGPAGGAQACVGCHGLVVPAPAPQQEGGQAVVEDPADCGSAGIVAVMGVRLLGGVGAQLPAEGA